MFELILMVYRNFVQPERLLVNSKKKKNPEKDEKNPEKIQNPIKHPEQSPLQT